MLLTRVGKKSFRRINRAKSLYTQADLGVSLLYVVQWFSAIYSGKWVLKTIKGLSCKESKAVYAKNYLRIIKQRQYKKLDDDQALEQPAQESGAVVIPAGIQGMRGCGTKGHYLAMGLCRPWSCSATTEILVCHQHSFCQKFKTKHCSSDCEQN